MDRDLVLFVALNVFAGPMTELYFRGYLLPRMARFGRWRPHNAALFSPPILVAVAVPVARRRGHSLRVRRGGSTTCLGMAVHVLLNGIGTATVSS
jgi:membrane protease YdiL (CAAX protease family)